MEFDLLVMENVLRSTGSDRSDLGISFVAISLSVNFVLWKTVDKKSEIDDSLSIQ